MPRRKFMAGTWGATRFGPGEPAWSPSSGGSEAPPRGEGRNARGSTRAGRGRRGGRLAAALAAGCLGLALLAATRPAAAFSDCADCAEPSLADLAQDPAFRLDTRTGVFGQAEDVVEFDGGECSADVVGSPTYSRVNSWMVLRGIGEVWDCPESRSCEKMIAEIREEDSKDWTTTGGGTLGFSVGGLTLGAKLEAAVKRGFHVTLVTRLEKEMCAKFCHRIQWLAYFEVAEYRATVAYKVERRYAWWTKNRTTGDLVHASGDVYVLCDAGTATFGMTAPIGGYFRLYDRGCETAPCTPTDPRDLGYFPPLDPLPPPPPPPPLSDVTPPAGGGTGGTDGAKDAEADAPAHPDDGEADDDAPALPPKTSEPLPDDLGDPPAGPVAPADADAPLPGAEPAPEEER